MNRDQIAEKMLPTLAMIGIVMTVCKGIVDVVNDALPVHQRVKNTFEEYTPEKIAKAAYKYADALVAESAIAKELGS